MINIFLKQHRPDFKSKATTARNLFFLWHTVPTFKITSLVSIGNFNFYRKKKNLPKKKYSFQQNVNELQSVFKSIKTEPYLRKQK